MLATNSPQISHTHSDWSILWGRKHRVSSYYPPVVSDTSLFQTSLNVSRYSLTEVEKGDIKSEQMFPTSLWPAGCSPLQLRANTSSSWTGDRNVDVPWEPYRFWQNVCWNRIGIICSSLMNCRESREHTNFKESNKDKSTRSIFLSQTLLKTADVYKGCTDLMGPRISAQSKPNQQQRPWTSRAKPWSSTQKLYTFQNDLLTMWWFIWDWILILCSPLQLSSLETHQNIGNNLDSVEVMCRKAF